MNVYVSLPLCGSVFIELRDEWVGFGLIKHPRGDKEIFLGRIQITYSPSQRPWKMIIPSIIAIIIALVVAYNVPYNLDGGNRQLTFEETCKTNYPLFTNNPTMDKEITPD